MAEQVILEYVDNVHLKVHAEAGTKFELRDHLSFEAPGAKFHPLVKNRVWDGIIRLYNPMTSLVYTGLRDKIADFCDSRGYQITVDDRLYPGKEVDDDFGYKLAEALKTKFPPRDYQNAAVVHMIRSGRAVIESPTASGKSFIIYLYSMMQTQLRRRVLVIVPTVSLVDQMASDFVDYNNGSPLSIYKIRAGVDKNNIEEDIVVSTWQSIVKMPKKWFEQFDVVIGDEAHTFKAKSLMKIMDNMPHVKYRFGFTGTVNDEAVNKLTLIGLFGSIYKVTSTKTLIENKTLANFNIKAIVLQHSKEVRKQVIKSDYQAEMDWIVRNEARNKFIRNLAYSLKGNTLILFQYVDKHGKVLYNMMKDSDRHDVHLIHGGVAADDREAIRHLAESSRNNIVIASFGTFQAGVNIVNLDNMILASGGKSKIRNLQSIGRVLRRGADKENATMFDIVDDLCYGSRKNFAVRHFEERYKIYIKEGFKVNVYPVELGGSN